MQKRPIMIALAVAGLIAGTTAGIAAINSDVSATAAPAALQPATDVKAPDTQAAVETQAPNGELVAQAQTDVPAPAQTVAAPTRSPAPPAARSNDNESMVRIPFTDYYVRVTNPTFPSAGLELPDPLPATIAYFDRLEASRLAASQPAPVAKAETMAPVATLDLPTTTSSPLKTDQATTQAALSGN